MSWLSRLGMVRVLSDVLDAPAQAIRNRPRMAVGVFFVLGVLVFAGGGDVPIPWMVSCGFLAGAALPARRLPRALSAASALLISLALLLLTFQTSRDWVELGFWVTTFGVFAAALVSAQCARTGPGWLDGLLLLGALVWLAGAPRPMIGDHPAYGVVRLAISVVMIRSFSARPRFWWTSIVVGVLLVFGNLLAPLWWYGPGRALAELVQTVATVACWAVAGRILSRLRLAEFSSAFPDAPVAGPAVSLQVRPWSWAAWSALALAFFAFFHKMIGHETMVALYPIVDWKPHVVAAGFATLPFHVSLVVSLVALHTFATAPSLFDKVAGLIVAGLAAVVPILFLRIFRVWWLFGIGTWEPVFKWALALLGSVVIVFASGVFVGSRSRSARLNLLDLALAVVALPAPCLLWALLQGDGRLDLLVSPSEILGRQPFATMLWFLALGVALPVAFHRIAVASDVPRVFRTAVLTGALALAMAFDLAGSGWQANFWIVATSYALCGTAVAVARVCRSVTAVPLDHPIYVDFGPPTRLGITAEPPLSS